MQHWAAPQRRKLAQWPNLLPAKLLATIVKMPVEIHWIQLTAPWGRVAMQQNNALCKNALTDIPIFSMVWVYIAISLKPLQNTVYHVRLA